MIRLIGCASSFQEPFSYDQADTKLSLSNSKRTVEQERTTMLFKFETRDLNKNSSTKIVSFLLIH